MNREPDHAFTELKCALDTGGVRAAVERLNSLSPHRFTSLYRFQGETLSNITFFDRENPDVESCESIPIESSYCVFVRNSSSTFTIDAAAGDERVAGHPKQMVVQRYCGVPLMDHFGKMIGTICHFDLEPGRISDRDVELLEYMAHLLQPKL